MTLSVSMLVSAQTIYESDGFKWVKFVEDGYVGAKDINGEVLVPANYSDCYVLSEYFFARDNCGYYAVYDKLGRIVIPGKKYITITLYAVPNSPFRVIGKRLGMLSSDGKVLLEDKYDSVDLYGDAETGYFVITDNGYKGIADLDGTIIIEPDRYHEVGRIGNHIDGHYAYMIYTDGGNQSGVCDLDGNEIIRTDYYQTLSADAGPTTYYKVVKGDSVGQIDLEGNVIVAPKPSERITSLHIPDRHIVRVTTKDDKFGAMIPGGKWIVPAEYDKLDVFGNKRFITVWKGNYMGAYDLDGNCLVSTDEKFISLAEFNNTIIASNADKKSALYSMDGRLLFPPIHTNVSMNTYTLPDGKIDTLVAFKDDRLWGIKRLDGSLVVPAVYHDLNKICSELGTYILVFRDNKVGVCDYNTGREIIPPIFTDVKIAGNDKHPFFNLKSGSKCSVAALNGDMIIPSEVFDHIDFNARKGQFTAYEGSRVCTFDFNGVLLKDTQTQGDRDEFIRLASEDFAAGNYQSAIKYYTNAIEIRPSAALYFNRGASYYNMDLYSKAISEFKKCLASDPSQHLIDQSRYLIRTSQLYIHEKQVQRQKIAANILGLVFSTAYTVMKAVVADQYSYSSNSTMAPSSGSSSHSTSHTSISRSSHDEPAEQKAPTKICRICKGDGKCLSCHGSGFRTDNAFGTGVDYSKKCGVCGGDGICNICKGVGYTY